jgi:hypothetical protein
MKTQMPALSFVLANSKKFEQGTPPEVIAAGPKLS